MLEWYSAHPASSEEKTIIIYYYYSFEGIHWYCFYIDIVPCGMLQQHVRTVLFSYDLWISGMCNHVAEPKYPCEDQTSCPCIPKKAHVFNSYLPFLVSDLILQENRRVDIVILGMNAVECMMVLHGFHPVTFSVKCYLIFSFRFVDTCMDQVNQGINKEEAIENTVKMLFASNVTTMPVSEILLIL